MLEAIEKLLILQDRDRQILRTQAELSGIGPQRTRVENNAADSRAALEAAKLKARHNESDRKRLELEVEAQKEKIARYSTQQFQTKKNEEYRVLAHEIETCRAEISRIEDQILELMERADVLQAEVMAATKASTAAAKSVDTEVGELNKRERNFESRLADLRSNRSDLAVAVEEGALARYERLLRQRGENVLVGIQHGVCGGCHMKLPMQVVVACQGQVEVNSCPHCGRILYYTRDMELAEVD